VKSDILGANRAADAMITAEPTRSEGIERDLVSCCIPPIEPPMTAWRLCQMVKQQRSPARAPCRRCSTGRSIAQG
jgi:hypothetical protein